MHLDDADRWCRLTATPKLAVDEWQFWFVIQVSYNKNLSKVENQLSETSHSTSDIYQWPVGQEPAHNNKAIKPFFNTVQHLYNSHLLKGTYKTGCYRGMITFEIGYLGKLHFWELKNMAVIGRWLFLTSNHGERN